MRRSRRAQSRANRRQQKVCDSMLETMCTKEQRVHMALGWLHIYSLDVLTFCQVTTTTVSLLYLYVNVIDQHKSSGCFGPEKCGRHFLSVFLKSGFTAIIMANMSLFLGGFCCCFYFFFYKITQIFRLEEEHPWKQVGERNPPTDLDL